jgi:hypothetical protein
MEFFPPLHFVHPAHLSCMDECLQLPAEFHIDLAGSNLDDDAYAELRMIDAVTGGELLLHRISPKRANLFVHGGGLFFRASRRRASRRGSGRALSIDVIAVTCAALDAPYGTVGVDRGDDMFTDVFALPTICVHIAPDLGAFNDTERILRHYF